MEFLHLYTNTFHQNRFKDLYFQKQSMFQKTILFFSFYISQVFGHGFMQLPSSRNLEAFKNGNDYDFMGLSGGGVIQVRRNSLLDTYIYPDSIENGNSRHGMCGDPVGMLEKYNGNLSEYSIVSTFEKGQTLSMDIVLTSHHKGHFEFYICNKNDLSSPENGIHQECLYQNRLLRDETYDSISPIDGNFPWRYYVEPSTCMEFQLEPYPGFKTTVHFKLPSELVCDHCVLQWWYFTGNSCNYQGYDNFEGIDCEIPWYNKDLPRCEGSTAYPEEFWNCADIKIYDPTLKDTEEKLNCKAISSRVSDKWCQEMNCDPVFKDYCSYEKIVSEYDCVSIDPTIPDRWCQNVDCDDAYNQYCSKVNKI